MYALDDSGCHSGAGCGDPDHPDAATFPREVMPPKIQLQISGCALEGVPADADTEAVLRPPAEGGA